MALTSEFINCCVIKVETESVPCVVNQLCHLVKGLMPIGKTTVPSPFGGVT